MSTFYPVGTVLPFAGEMSQSVEKRLKTAGFLPCDGRALDNDQYKALNKAIGGAYGSTNTQFYIPDYRGRFLRGTDLHAKVDPDASSRTAPNPGIQNPGNTGDAVGSIQSDQFSAHQHQYTSYHGDHKIDLGGAEKPGVYETSTTSGTSGSFGGNETRPINAYVNFIIAYQ